MPPITPLRDAPETSAPLSPWLRLPPAPRSRVLIADDDRGIRESLGNLLRRANYEVAFAAHGGQVLELALSEHFDALLLDLNMPQMDGWDALNHLASMQPALPVIVITAQPNQREWVATGGAHALLEKPLDLPLLLQTLEEVLREPPVSATGNRERFRYGWPRRSGSAADHTPSCGGIND